METVLPWLGFVFCQEQYPWQPIHLWLNLKHDRVVIDDHPLERLTPPAAKRTRVTGSDNDLLPLKTHGRTIAARPQRCPEFLAAPKEASVPLRGEHRSWCHPQPSSSSLPTITTGKKQPYWWGDQYCTLGIAVLHR
jgi:hypothetical protein